MPRTEYYLPQRRLVSQDDSAIVPRADVPRSRFINEWSRKTTFDAGKLIPFLIDDILPGDHMTYNVTAMVRMDTPLFPMFDSQRVDTHFFYVPNRILWEDWVNFMGEQADPDSSIEFLSPYIDCPAGGYTANSIFDQMGLPIANIVAPGEVYRHSALPLRAYHLIWNNWFRDQNIQDSVPVPLSQGGDLYSIYSILPRAKSHDYFTSCLPNPQKFSPPSIPLSGLAPVRGIAGVSLGFQTPGGTVHETGGVDTAYTNYKRLWFEGGDDQMVADIDENGYPLIFADLAALGIGINTFRQAIMTQSLLERDARGGTRYPELIKAHFGVTNPDFRLQRPEYIGGGQTPLDLTPIANTAGSEALPLGALGAAGTAAGQHTASYAATEHGWIIGLISVRSELSYQQGLPRMWSRTTRYDYYWPSFALLGEQAVLRKEIYCTGDAEDDEIVFGYQERWQEYRTRYSEVTGQFRSTTTGTLDPWHLAQEFSPAPTLSPAFIVDNPPMARVLAAGVSAEFQQYKADILIRRTAVRPIPTNGVPATLGRF